MLDGKPALPQREGDKVLIALPATGQSTLRDLQLVYESKTNEVFLRGRLSVLAPELAEREDVQSEQMPIPIADVKWDLVLPHGYEVTWTGGNVSPSHYASNAFSFNRLMERIWEFGGGGSLANSFDTTAVSTSNWDARPMKPRASVPPQAASKSAASSQAMREMDAILPDSQVIEPSFGRPVVPSDKAEAMSVAPSQMAPTSGRELALPAT